MPQPNALAGDDRPGLVRLHVAVVSHTHWDREWYHGVERFRQRLVALVDALLDHPGAGSFLLDGQAIVLEDYLRVRPERVAELAAALQSGAIEAGPWYVLADNQIPSGEALLRNLEAGRRVLRRFSADAPPVLYCPDTFGHPAAMPHVAAGYGFRVAVLWRGAGGAQHPPQDAFRWASASGEGVIVHHLPPDGYEFGSDLPIEGEGARERWDRLGALVRKRAATGVVLLLNGADHHARQPALDARLDHLVAAAAPDADVWPSSLRAWAERFAMAAEQIALPTVHGALRDSYGYTWTLAGTLATRAHQKRTNAVLERMLLRDVEPWMAVARLHHSLVHAPDSAGRIMPSHGAPLLHRAWEDLLATHPHDTLCGCSVDAVARAMTQRQEEVLSQGLGVREAALQWLVGLDPVAARAHGVRSANAPVMVRNRAPRRRDGLAVITVIDTLADVPVGPASGEVATSSISATRPRTTIASGWITQELAQSTRYLRRESPQHYPDNDLVMCRRLLIWIPPIPPTGLATLTLHEPPHTEMATPSVFLETHGARIQFGNDHLTVTVHDPDAAPRVSLAIGGRRIDDVCWLETRSDVGDTYTPAPRGEAERLRAVRAWVRHAGPLRASVRIAWSAPGTMRCVGERGAVRVVTDLEVDAGSHVLRCRIRGTNRRTDHRLQFVWRTDLAADATIVADAAFGPDVGTPIYPPPHAKESVPPGIPLHRWLSVVGRGRAATLISDGLAEAEPAAHRIAVTLLRATGELSRNDLPERPGHAGWPQPVPEAQCLGSFQATVGLLLHRVPPSGVLDADALRDISCTVDDELLPLVGESWRELTAPPRDVTGVALHGAGFEVGAITIAETDPEAVILRAVNLTSAVIDGVWDLPDEGPWEVTPCRLDETATGPTTRHAGRVVIRSSARGIVTLRVRRAPLEPVADQRGGEHRHE